MEMENVYKVIDEELRPVEKDRLVASLKKYLSDIHFLKSSIKPFSGITGRGTALWAKSQQVGK